ncbi:MAG: patatin-like phospholipase family protein [Massilia sp.]
MPIDFDALRKQEAPSLADSPLGPAGLALSGGGIRSATFSLGVLQALAVHGKLASFDYLSTVSGGGYIGGWLSAWIHRSSLDEVQAELAKPCGNRDGNPASQEHGAISWLRRYSNYLSPRVGLMSIDALTLITTWIRNVLLNLVILLALFALLALLPRTLVWPAQSALANSAATALAMWVALGALAIMLVAMMFNFFSGQGPRKSWPWVSTGPGVMCTVLVPGGVAACAASLWLFGSGSERLSLAGMALFAMLLGVWLLWLMFTLVRGLASKKLKAALSNFSQEATAFVLASAVCVAVSAGLMAAASAGFAALKLNDPVYQSVVVITFGPTAFLVMFGIVGSIFVGIVGRAYAERSREWWSRMNACFLIAGLGWLALTACAFYVPALVEWAAANAGPWLKAAAGASWLTAALGVLVGPRVAGKSDKARIRMMSLVNALAIVLMLTFIVAAESLTDTVLSALNRPATSTASVGKALTVDLHLVDKPGELTHRVTIRAQGMRFGTALNGHMAQLRQSLENDMVNPALLATLAVLLLFGWRVDVNIFSLHNMYKSRLIRCYLGASRASGRRANPFTGFDEDDDIVLARLADANGKVQRPLHILNASLNLSQGKNLAWQERKAASFVLTPQVCGFQLAKTQGDSRQQGAYRPTAEYGRRGTDGDGFSLGMAMATSGAAISPNMGLTSNPALAFILTVFNIRLGRWSANPARDAWRDASPAIGLVALFSELFGFSNETSNFVYLSDGGHFDNTGIYELVRRRCRVIYVVDAGADGDLRFEDLGRAIRQCRIDFGVDIDIDLKDMRKDGETLPQSGFAQGSIHFNDGTPDGILICIKPTLCAERDEPVDIHEFGARNASFPHQTTADQFFNESQFESYRLLGKHIGEACLRQTAQHLPPAVSAPRRERQIAAQPVAVLPEVFKMLSVFTILFSFAFILIDKLGWRNSSLFDTIDSGYALLYTALFCVQYRLLAGHVGKGLGRYWGLALLWGGTALALTGGLCDLLENLRHWQHATTSSVWPQVFDYTDVKFKAFFVNLIGWLALALLSVRRRL